MSDEERWTVVDDVDAAFFSTAIGAGSAKPQGIIAAVSPRCCDQHHYSCALAEDDPPLRCCPDCPYGKTQR